METDNQVRLFSDLVIRTCRECGRDVGAWDITAKGIRRFMRDARDAGDPLRFVAGGVIHDHGPNCVRGRAA